MRATRKGATIAESDDAEVEEGIHCFPPGAVNQPLQKPSDNPTNCWWQGQASDGSIAVDGKVHAGAAWCDRDPKPDAAHLRDRVTCWRGVKVV